MRIVQQSVGLEWATPNPELAIERAGRTCYKSEEKITEGSAATFVRMVLARGHESVIEHASASFRIVCDRGISHEIVRHRLASYCLAGNTAIVAYSATKGRSPKRWTLQQLFDWQNDDRRKGRLKLIRVRSVDIDGLIVPGRINRVMDSGIQPLLKMTMRSAREIKATARHRFMTPDGWKPLGALSISDRVVVNGLPLWANKEWIEQKYITENMTRSKLAARLGICDALLGKHIRRLGIKKPLSLRKNRHGGCGRKGMHSVEGLQRMSASKRGANNPQWKGASVGPGGGRMRAQKLYKPDMCWACGCRTLSKLERHHLDENPANNMPDNIRYLCHACHKSFHLGAAVLAVHSDEIVNIEPIGNEQTFDVEMACEPHNFVAQGFVVHNSQESTRYCNYGGEIAVIEPPGLVGDLKYTWLDACKAAEAAYLILVSCRPPQIARSVLPTCLKTELVMTCNFREWRHFLSLRLSPKAHPQMQEIAAMIRDKIVKLSPACFGEFVVTAVGV